MQKVNGTTITLTKGDTFKAVVKMNKPNGGLYAPEQGDVIRFAMKKKYSDATPLLEKVIPHDSLQLQIDHADTESLAVGDYVYDIEITYANGDVDTFIAEAVLKLTDEVK